MKSMCLLHFILSKYYELLDIYIHNILLRPEKHVLFYF